MAEEKSAGRPTDYREEMNDQVYKLCMLGATDEQIADFFDIQVSTLNNWKKRHPAFMESIKQGKMGADMNVVNSLYKRATGYTAKKVVTANTGGIITDVKEVDEYVGPDTGAAIFWLKNRQPKQWRDKQDIAHSGQIDSNQTVISAEATPEQAAEVYAKLMG